MINQKTKGQISAEFLISIVVILGIFIISFSLFNSRVETNQYYSDLWQAKEIAQKIARNINTVYLMDENATFTDTIYWNDATNEITENNNILSVWYNTTNFYTEVIFADYNLIVQDYNGPIVFEKRNGIVTVRN